MERAFLDANVLFSAAYDPSCRLLELWQLADVELVASAYVAAEAYHNVSAKCPHRMKALHRLLATVKLVIETGARVLPPGLVLPAKDLPVMEAALACDADVLLTGDKHFSRYFGRVIGGTLVLRPGDYLRMRQRR
jgi:predicted nucleic acid-binding protein